MAAVIALVGPLNGSRGSRATAVNSVCTVSLTLTGSHLFLLLKAQ